MENNQFTYTTRIPHDHDVLCGRGGRTLRHPGNYAFRSIVLQTKASSLKCRFLFTRINKLVIFDNIQARYAESDKFEKIKIAKEIVNIIKRQNPSGRFLRHDSNKNLWIEVEDKIAVDKTSQALREKKSYCGSRQSESTDEISMDSQYEASNLTPEIQENTSDDSRLIGLNVAMKDNSSAGIKTPIADDKEINYLIYQTFCIPTKLGHDSDSDHDMSTSTSNHDAISMGDSKKVASNPIKACLSETNKEAESQVLHGMRKEEYLPYARQQEETSKIKSLMGHKNDEASFIEAEIKGAKKKAKEYKILRSKAA